MRLSNSNRVVMRSTNFCKPATFSWWRTMSKSRERQPELRPTIDAVGADVKP